MERFVTKEEINPLWQAFVDEHTKHPYCAGLGYRHVISMIQGRASVLVEFAVASSSCARNVLQNLEFHFYV